jgi:hypothetical protein
MDSRAQTTAGGLRLSSCEPARYVIHVQGVVAARWSDRLGGMELTQVTDCGVVFTILSGILVDQAALLGVLNSLYNLGLPLLSVQCLGTLAGNHERSYE